MEIKNNPHEDGSNVVSKIHKLIQSVHRTISYVFDKDYRNIKKQEKRQGKEIADKERLEVIAQKREKYKEYKEFVDAELEKLIGKQYDLDNHYNEKLQKLIRNVHEFYDKLLSYGTNSVKYDSYDYKDPYNSLEEKKEGLKNEICNSDSFKAVRSMSIELLQYVRSRYRNSINDYYLYRFSEEVVKLLKEFGFDYGLEQKKFNEVLGGEYQISS